MEDRMYSCPICHGNVLFEDMAAPPGARPTESAIMCTRRSTRREVLLQELEMEDRMYSCPICHGNVLFEDMAAPPGARPTESAITQKFYCPHCEMLVEPVITSAEEREEEGVAERDAATENRGRTEASGSNAGGSQRGDLSDEGASQWRTDPRETERNTWEDKP